MNLCHICETIVNRFPYDKRQHFCDPCKAERDKQRKALEQMEAQRKANIANYWTLPPSAQAIVKSEIGGK